MDFTVKFYHILHRMQTAVKQKKHTSSTSNITDVPTYWALLEIQVNDIIFIYY